MNETLGDRLTRYMKLAKVKNPDVAAVTHTDATTVSKWRSDVQAPGEAKLAAVVELLRRRGVSTSVHEMKYGREGTQVREQGEARMYGFGEIDFETVTAKQRARVTLEGMLLKLAELGASERFIAAARRLLLNPANYDPDLSPDGAMSDDAKLRHMQSLAAGVLEALRQSADTSELRERFEQEAEEILSAKSRAAAKQRRAGGSGKGR